jgi:hypothetical protein
MKKILGWLIWFPLGLAVVWFLVANRQPVAISLDPFTIQNPAIASPPLPLWVWLTLSLLVGFALGAVGMWSSGTKARRRVKADNIELRNLRRDAAARAATPSDPAPMIEARDIGA